MDGVVEGVRDRVLWSRRVGFSTLVGTGQGSTNRRSATCITARLPSPVDPAGLDPDSIQAIERLERAVDHLSIGMDLDSGALSMTIRGEEPTAKRLQEMIVLLARTAGRLSSR